MSARSPENTNANANANAKPKPKAKARATLLAMTAALVAVGVKLVTGCIDTTPIFVARDAQVVTGTPCRDCVLGSDEAGIAGRCLDVAAECLADPKCARLYQCAVEAACLDAPTVDDKIRCGLPCGQEAGISGANDPAIDQLFAILACGERECAEPCHLGDAAPVIPADF